MDADTAEPLAEVVRLLRRAAELVWVVVDAEGAGSPRQLLVLGIELAADGARNLSPDGIPVDGPVFSTKLENLQAKVNETVATARAAAAENREQLKQRVDQALVEANQAMEDTKQQAEKTADRAQSKWAQMKADAAAR